VLPLHSVGPVCLPTQQQGTKPAPSSTQNIPDNSPFRNRRPPSLTNYASPSTYTGNQHRQPASIPQNTRQNLLRQTPPPAAQLTLFKNKPAPETNTPNPPLASLPPTKIPAQTPPPAQLTLSKNKPAPETNTPNPPLASLPPTKIPAPAYAAKPAFFQQNSPVATKIFTPP